jgi:large subunit ribosomal protein L24
MKNKLKIHRDDVVVVIAGKHKGRTGKVVRVLPQEGRVVVEGVALVKRHVKPQQDRAGTIIEKEAAIHISNVALWDAATGKRVKVGYQIKEDGTKIRVNRKTGAAV